jgi:rhodanese-related sulfurtransferase
MDITVEGLHQKLGEKENFIFIDVREGYEYEEFNLGARLIPLGELMNHLSDISVDKDAEIVVHCRSGNRSAMAKQILLQSGYTQVRNLLGGVMEWQSKYGFFKP